LGKAKFSDRLETLQIRSVDLNPKDFSNMISIVAWSLKKIELSDFCNGHDRELQAAVYELAIQSLVDLQDLKITSLDNTEPKYFLYIADREKFSLHRH